MDVNLDNMSAGQSLKLGWRAYLAFGVEQLHAFAGAGVGDGVVLALVLIAHIIEGRTRRRR